MRAGLGHPSDEPSPPAGVADVTRRMMALVVSMVGRAGENAALYAVHAGRKTVVPQDVHRAMQYQSKVFLTDVTEDDVEEALEDVTRACEATSSDDDDDDAESSTDDCSTESTGSNDDGSESSSEEAENEATDNGDETWTSSACTCETCLGMNEAHDTWDSYAPEDEALAYVKGLTDSFLKKSAAGN